MANKVYRQQKDFNLPGLVIEIKEELKKMEMTLESMEEMSRNEWKRFVEEKINSKNEGELRSSLKECKKSGFEEISEEVFEMKNYMRDLSYDDSLLKFRLRAGVSKYIRTHYKRDEENERETWSCWETTCTSLDTTNHILHECRNYESLKNGLDFTKDNDVILFFRRVFEKREKDRTELEREKEEQNPK